MYRFNRTPAEVAFYYLIAIRAPRLILARPVLCRPAGPKKRAISNKSQRLTTGFGNPVSDNPDRITRPPICGYSGSRIATNELITNSPIAIRKMCCAKVAAVASGSPPKPRTAATTATMRDIMAPLNTAVPLRPLTRLADSFDNIRWPRGSSRLGNYSHRSFLADISLVVAIMQGGPRQH